MRPFRYVPLLALLVLISVAPSFSQFGIMKKKVYLQVKHPPETYVPGRQVRLEVQSSMPVGMSAVAQLRPLLEQQLSSGGFEVSGGQPETLIRVVVNQFDPRVYQQVRRESRNIHAGYRTEYDKNGKAYQVENCKWEDVNVTRHVARGALALSLVLQDVATGVRLADEIIPVDISVDLGVAGPKLCGVMVYDAVSSDYMDAASLGNFLIQQARARMQRKLFGWVESVEVLLATPDELKPGNSMAMAGQWPQALEGWQNARVKSGKAEAYRQYNLGVAFEAIAYSTLEVEQALTLMKNAEGAYNKAMQLHPEEKYFRPAFARVNKGRLALDRTREQQVQRQTEAAKRQVELEEETAKERSPVQHAQAPPSEEPPQAKQFREYVRMRVSRVGRPLDANQREGFVQDGIRFGLEQLQSVDIVSAEEQQAELTRQMVARYQGFYQECWQDHVITPDERRQLEVFRQTLKLPEELTVQVEKEFQLSKPAPSSVRPAMPAKSAKKP